MRTTWTATRRTELRDRGLVSLPGLLSPADAAVMCDRVWDFLGERDGVARDDPSSWVGVSASGFQPLRKTDPFAALDRPQTRALIDDVIGSGWEVPRRWGALLLTFPGDGEWQLPRQSWHTDIPHSPGRPEAYGVQLFVFLDEVRPRGGGTLVVEGSHRLIAAIPEPCSSSQVRKRLRREHAWFRDLWQTTDSRIARLMDRPTAVAGVEVQVRELTGAPGDAALMDMRLLHTSAPNALDRPRMMLTERFRRAADA